MIHCQSIDAFTFNWVCEVYGMIMNRFVNWYHQGRIPRLFGSNFTRFQVFMEFSQRHIFSEHSFIIVITECFCILSLIWILFVCSQLLLPFSCIVFIYAYTVGLHQRCPQSRKTKTGRKTCQQTFRRW